MSLICVDCNQEVQRGRALMVPGQDITLMPDGSIQVVGDPQLYVQCGNCRAVEEEFGTENAKNVENFNDFNINQVFYGLMKQVGYESPYDGCGHDE